MRPASVSPSRRSPPIDPLGCYLRDIGAYPLLSHDEELELSERARAGDREAVERLVCSNLRFVVSVAKKFQNQGVPLSDLINEGNLGLVRAAERFDGTKGVKFVSYAVWWIRRAVFQALADQGRAVRVPLGRAGEYHRIRRRTNAMRQELGRDPTQQEIACEMDITEDEVETSLRVSRDALSLDAPLASGESGQLLDYIPDELTADPDAEDSGDVLAATVEHAMSHLRARDAEVLRLYFGFGDNEPLTLEDIGTRFGITRERVRQLKERALSRLRRSADASVLVSLREL